MSWLAYPQINTAPELPDFDITCMAPVKRADEQTACFRCFFLTYNGLIARGGWNDLSTLCKMNTYVGNWIRGIDMDYFTRVTIRLHHPQRDPHEFVLLAGEVEKVFDGLKVYFKDSAHMIAGPLTVEVRYAKPYRPKHIVQPGDWFGER